MYVFIVFWRMCSGEAWIDLAKYMSVLGALRDIFWLSLRFAICGTNAPLQALFVSSKEGDDTFREGGADVKRGGSYSMQFIASRIGFYRH